MNFDDFNANYDLKELIGSGAFCTVRKAIRKDTRQVFAAKMYHNEQLKAKNEIDLLIRLDHPSIVNIYEYYEDEGLIILILQFMQGGELYDQVSQRQQFTERQVINYMKILVDAVRYCHELGIVHRDIKPENLLLTTRGPDGILKLADFGISKILSEEMLSTNCGTPIYMAPEIWGGKSYNEKVDMWSIGIVMYFLLSGQHPFNGDNDDNHLLLGQEIMTSEVTFHHPVWNQISSCCNCFSDEAISLLKQLLSKSPQDRPTARDVAEQFLLNRELWQSEDQDQHLGRTVMSVRRKIFKARFAQKKKFLLHIMKVKKLPKKRIYFLVSPIESEENTTQDSEYKERIEEDF